MTVPCDFEASGGQNVAASTLYFRTKRTRKLILRGISTGPAFPRCRSVWSATKTVPHLMVISLSAEPEVPAARLSGRARDFAADITRRLERAAQEVTVTTALSALYCERV